MAVVREPAYLPAAAASKDHIGLGTVEVVGGDKDGFSARRLRMCEYG